MSTATEVFQVIVLAVQTIIIGLTLKVAKQQVDETRNEARRSRTIDACNKYDFDTVLNEALIKLNEANIPKFLNSAEPTPDERSELDQLKPYITTVLNYLDGLAIGIAQGIYENTIVHDHMRFIIRSHYKKLMQPHGLLKKFGLDEDQFANFKTLAESYLKTDTQYKTE